MNRASTFLPAVALAVAASLSSAPAAAVPTLEDLCAGQSITHGDKDFYNFRNCTSSGTLDVPLSQIFVFTILGGTNNDEYGLRFQSALWDLEGANLSYDLGFDFQVKTVSGKHWIVDNTLEITGGAEGDGHADVAEGVTDHETDETLANKFVYIESDEAKLIDHQEFPHPAAILDISKDFAMRTGDDPDSRVFVSHFDQTFSQKTPEPGSLALLGLGLAGLGLSRRRRAN